MSSIKKYESSISACFKVQITHITYNEDETHMYFHIPEDNNWRANCCVLKEWYFDYDAFEALKLFHIDCANYGTFVVSKVR